jgi:hypothetical protein
MILRSGGSRVSQEGPFEVWMKTRSDGSKVVGWFNRQNTTERDLWLKQDRGTIENSFSDFVPGHGVVLVRVSEN